MKYRIRRWMLWFVLLFMISYPVYQIFDFMGTKETRADAVQMLYEVSLFQMEMLHSELQEAATAERSSELNELKKTVYGANFTHDRLVAVVGSKSLYPMDSIKELMEYIMRLQIGGDRGLTDEEKEGLVQISEQFSQCYELYRELFSSEGKVYGSKRDELHQLDQSISQLIKELPFG